MSNRSFWEPHVSSRQEDEAVLEIFSRYGKLKWKEVVVLLQTNYGIMSKDHKQCRERWANHLNPELVKSPWTAEEEHTLFFYQRIFGNKWSKIARYLSNRPKNSVKNQFYSTLKKRIRHYNREHPESPLSEDLHQVMSDPDLIDLLNERITTSGFQMKKREKRTRNSAVQTEESLILFEKNREVSEKNPNQSPNTWNCPEAAHYQYSLMMQQYYQGFY